MKKLLLIFSSLLIGQSPLTFSISTVGTHHVTVGNYILVQVNGTVISGTDVGGIPTVTNTPKGISTSWPSLTRFCCGAGFWQVSGSQTLKISAGNETNPGTYPLVITYTVNGVSASTPFNLVVDPLPAKQSQVNTTSVPMVILQSKWLDNMLTFGKLHCNLADAAFIASANDWYYDGIWVYYQISNYTNDKAWETCAQLVLTQPLTSTNPLGSYRDYVLANTNPSTDPPTFSTGIPGYAVYARGIAENYQRTKDPLSLKAVNGLADSPYASVAYRGNWAYQIDWSTSRETALAIRAQYAYQLIGGQLGPNFQDLIEIAIGHMNQWFVDKSATYVQPFMVALTCESLIDYWNQTKDPRIPPLIQLAADSLMNSWDKTSQSWMYNNGDGTSGPAPDLNLLIIPLYGFVFNQTGLTKYRDYGDAGFNSGVNGAYLEGGKQFSQNYHWSFQYLSWRNVNPPVQSSCGPILTITAAGVSWPAGSCKGVN